MRSNGCVTKLRMFQGVFASASAIVMLGSMAIEQARAAQVAVAAPVPFSGITFVNPGLGNYAPMRVPPKGIWCQVIMANPKWMVLEDEEGRQYPLSAQAINQFLVRWPTGLGAIGIQSLVEASGVDVGSNTVRTDHVDVFESDAYSLATPTVVANFGFNSLVNPSSLGLQNAFGGVNPIVNPIVTGELSQPTVRTVVGQAISTNPLQVSLGSNNFATILPSNDSGMSMTRVTLGTTALGTPGDVVFISASAMNTKSLTANQVVLYKRVAFGVAPVGPGR